MPSTSPTATPPLPTPSSSSSASRSSILPYLRHPVDETGRESGLLIPVLSNFVHQGLHRRRAGLLGHQPQHGHGHRLGILLQARLRAQRRLPLQGPRPRPPDRPLECPARPRHCGHSAGNRASSTRAAWTSCALGRKDSLRDTRVAGNVEYLSSYVYRLVFNDNYSQAVSSEVHSTLSLTHAHNGFIPSASLDRLQTFASSTTGDEARILHLPSLRFDALDRPLGSSPLYWGLGSSIGHLSRSEPGFHAHNVGRFDLYPASLTARSSPPAGASFPKWLCATPSTPAARSPTLTGANGGTPYHQPRPAQPLRC